MPRYAFQADVPAGTAESAAVEESIEVEERVITEARRFVPPGADSEVHAVLRFGEAPLLPTANSATLLLPGNRPFAPVNAELPGVPTEVNVKAWAPNSDFQHTVTVEFDAVSRSNAAQDVRVVGVGQAVQNPLASVSPEDIQNAGSEE